MALAANASRVFHRNLNASFPQAETGAGAYITDATGKRYLDASGGAAVSCLGHGNVQVIEAIKAQLDAMAFAHTSFFTSGPAEELAEVLSAKAPGGAWRIYFVSGGSEANEAALKLARQIQVVRGQSDRTMFVARDQSYHGNTLGVLSVSGNPGRQQIYKPILLDNVARIMPCYAYRHAQEGESDAAFGARAASALGICLDEIGPDRAIAFIAETVVGATLGAVPPAPGYFAEIRRICDETGTLLILDEVMSGMGRTGSLFACEQEGIIPDMITVAKGLGGGYQPIGALMVRDELAAEIEAAGGVFQHGHTYIGHPAACAAGLAVQRVFEEQDLIARVETMGGDLHAALEARFGDHPHVGDIRGRGFFRGLELVADHETKQPFDPARKLNGRIKSAAMENGLVCYPGGGTVDGKRGDHILLAPPFIITPDQIDELVDKLDASLKQALAS